MPIWNKNNKTGGIKSNDAITAPRLRVLGETGENLGILNLEEAKSRARTAGLDLVMVTESSDPPVVKITSYDKFRYQKEKELKKQKKQKNPESKRIQVSPREAEHDLLFKLKKLEEFLKAGHKVEIQMTLRGREKGMRDYARGKLEDFLGRIETPFKQTQTISPGGRGLTTQIEPK
ncbi:MAG: translation initiation factor IF-3 [Candidatus Colwellbacteria bacterium]|nr:translation initiation factor IF-3 [Candidatus Colwellbacteria bacterium]